MGKKIFRAMVALVGGFALMMAVYFAWFYYDALGKNVREDLATAVSLFAPLSGEEARLWLQRGEARGIRFTLVQPDGEVAYDSLGLGLDNHGQREEVAEAFVHGRGEAERYSASWGIKTYYQALRLQDGWVIRLAKSQASIDKHFGQFLLSSAMLLALVLALAYVLAKLLTRRIVEPINRLDLDTLSQPYEELAPLTGLMSKQRQKIEKQVLALEERAKTVESLMGNVTEAILLLDAQGRILSYNKSCQRFLGEGEQAGRMAEDFFRDGQVREALEAALGGERRKLEYPMGEAIYKLVLSPVKGVGVVMLFVDLTDRFRAERLRREFSANVSHELKTPLTSIFGQAQMLNLGMVRQEDLPGFYQSIQDESQRMIRLIEDILFLSRLDEKADLPQEALDMGQAVEECLAELAPMAKDKGVELHWAGESFTAQVNGVYFR